MKESAVYLKWISILCIVMAFFGIGVFIIGYKDLSFGRVATVVSLFVASAACAYLSKRQAKKRSNNRPSAPGAGKGKAV